MKFINLILLIFLFGLFSCKKNENPNVPQSKKPNIVFILADDVGYEIPTCDGGHSYSTPNIDNLAANGMRFTECHSAPVCSPSRFMILTGQYNFRNYTIWGQMNINQKTVGNLLKNAGYATCYAGKWQLNGGAQSANAFGFDNYSVWLPYYECPETIEGSRYKDARIYENGGYIQPEPNNDMYSDDHFTNYILNFIDNHKNDAFFVYYSMMLCHKAFSPTPEDAVYDAWNPDPANSNKKYFPSMVNYMDKKIGLILDKINSAGISNNTIVIFAGDNGTSSSITSSFLNGQVKGAKGSAIEYGIHVPLICKWPAVITSGSINNDLIDFTDFLPTFADIANEQVPTNFGVIDGNSFYKALSGNNSAARKWSFCYSDPHLCTDSLGKFKFAMDTAYKLYDSGEFFHYSEDIMETTPLTVSELSPQQTEIKATLQAVLDNMHN
ncbi:MAG: sulfatase-like hydrolase/transferase [Bacteroidetes bacterium]|nr:sulfatase-like hydrolase/transferase [Bacteroidota bacterium]